MARVLSADELREIHYGHGWVEYCPAKGIKPEKLLAEIAWVGMNRIIVDWCGRVRTGKMCVDCSKMRIWTERPTMEERKRVSW